MPIIEFDNKLSPQNSIDIDDLANICIEAANEETGEYYYLLVKTSLGFSSIFEYGPVVPDLKELCEHYRLSYSRMAYNQGKLLSYITKWLNDKYKGITYATIAEEQTFLDNMKDIGYTIKNHGEEVY